MQARLRSTESGGEVLFHENVTERSQAEAKRPQLRTQLAQS